MFFVLAPKNMVIKHGKKFLLEIAALLDFLEYITPPPPKKVRKELVLKKPCD